ncbi:glycosyltransferase family 4 protein [Calidifontibacter sp. DB0510]|uniref:Glycosyltransferase family 4 protein n=1 Tax=Metallococcus carri TaxID=1656884 RepID=A0A967EG26_9MICO|nr:glycosyltransferase family 4 protein [Metallococcus carri]NHN57166.1 glycosyltransferase family 4 protein [Metallococcus carri]NOP38031.1 glycosyltransferase family 4 protein [Calidifontibacter sp. DB2511S]
MRIALASYRSKPHSGGQGIYVRNLSRELVALGHQVEVFSGPPYPDLDDGVRLTRVPSLDLYRDDDPFRRPSLREFRSRTDVFEYAVMCTSGFPEPRTFGRRLERLLTPRLGEFDILHDNQTLAPGLLRLAKAGLPLLETIHHPISRDRRLELAHASGWQHLTKRRWYGFVAMQRRVARECPHVLTVSEGSARDLVDDFGLRRERISVVPVGVDVDTFRPPVAPRVPGRLVTIASADVPLKGLPVLIDALAVMPPTTWSELVVVGTPSERTNKALADRGLLDRVTFRTGISDVELAELIGSAQALVVPSLYEGFSLPAVEALACGTPLVASRVGALPDLVGDDAGRLVAPGDPQGLAQALIDTLADPAGAELAGLAGRRRAVATYSWRAVASATAALYEQVIADRSLAGPPSRRDA